MEVENCGLVFGVYQLSVVEKVVLLKIILKSDGDLKLQLFPGRSDGLYTI